MAAKSSGKRGRWGLALALVAACAAPAPEESGGRTPVDDVVLITIDTLRSDALGFTGNRRAVTPVLDRLAAGGRVFTDAHAHNVVTLPSHANILTGRLPYEHGVRDNGGFRLGPELPTLATRLRAAGFATAAVVAAYPLDPRYGLDRGFDLYDADFPEPGFGEFVYPERPAPEVVETALAWWREQRGRRRFLWLHLFDPHLPYEPPPPWDERFAAAPYLGEVAAVDAALRPLVAELLDGGGPPALVVVTSDHGEALGEHGELTHGLFAYEPTLAVPLVLWGAGVTPGTDDRPARHIDIAPTVLGAAGVPAEELPGADLLGPPVDGATYFEALSDHLNLGSAPLRGILVAGDKFIELPLPELYDLETDPGEARNLYAERRGRASELRASLPAESVWPPDPASLDDDERAALASLGYLSGRAPRKRSYGPEDDPKNLAALRARQDEALRLGRSGRLGEAIGMLRSIVDERPDNSLAYSYLTTFLLRRGDVAAALDVMGAAHERGVAPADLERQYGLSLAASGRADEALAVLRPLAERDGDVRTLNNLALAEAASGATEAALATLERAAEAEPDFARTWENRAFVLLQREEFAAADRAAQRAVELDPERSDAWHNLALARYRLGDAGGAAGAWERVVALVPGRLDAWFLLGLARLDAGEEAAARASLERFLTLAPPERFAAQIAEARQMLRRLDEGAR